KYLRIKMPELIETHHSDGQSEVISIPIKAPEGAITRDESPMDLLERMKRFNVECVQSGHRAGANFNNVSATVNLKEDQWGDAIDWLWDNRYTYNGITVFPYHGGTYKQAPFESISMEKYQAMREKVSSIDLEEVSEDMEYTDLQNTLACGPDGCEII